MTIDYLYGQRVTEIASALGGGEWSLTFEGGAVLTNYSALYPQAPRVHDAVLQRAVFDSQGTIMHFDNGVQVHFDPLQYTLTDAFEIVTYPQPSQVEDNSELPEDPSSERVADGPSQEWIDAEAERIKTEEREQQERAEAQTRAEEAEAAALAAQGVDNGEE